MVDFQPAVISSVDGLMCLPAPITFHFSAVSAARDCLSTYSGDYVFFQYDDDEYILILSDNWTESSTGLLSCEGFQAYDIVVTENYKSFDKVSSGTVSGDLVGVDAGASVQHFGGSVAFPYSFDLLVSDSVSLYYENFEHYTLSISNTNNGVLYSSFDGFAKLQNTETHYLYLLCAVAVGAIMFGLVHALFKRLV